MNIKLRTTEQLEPTLHSTRRRNGKVACLPKPQRDLVNHMLEDGAAYKEIVAALAQLGHSVSPRNISNWYQGGYQDWLLHQERLAANRIREEAVLDILTDNHDVDLPAAGLQIAATHLCQLLLAAHPETADPESGLTNYIRAANSLCRISRQLMKVQEFRDEYPSDPDDHNYQEDPDNTEHAETEAQDPKSNVQSSSHSTSTDRPSDRGSFNVQGSPEPSILRKSTNPPTQQSIHPATGPASPPSSPLPHTPAPLGSLQKLTAITK